MPYGVPPDIFSRVYATLSREVKEVYEALPLDYRPDVSDYSDPLPLITDILAAWELWQLEQGK